MVTQHPWSLQLLCSSATQLFITTHGTTFQVEPLGFDSITRWNSWFKLLDAATRQEGALSIFLGQFRGGLEDGILTRDDSQLFQMMHEFLKLLQKATMKLQKECAAIDQLLENMGQSIKAFGDDKVRVARTAQFSSPDFPLFQIERR